MDIIGAQTKANIIYMTKKIKDIAQRVIDKAEKKENDENRVLNMDENFLKHIIYYLQYNFGLNIIEFNNFIYLGTIMGILVFLDDDDDFFTTTFKTIDEEYEDLLIRASSYLESLYCFLVLGGNGNLDPEFHLSETSERKINKYNGLLEKYIKTHREPVKTTEQKNIAILSQFYVEVYNQNISIDRLIYGLMAAEIIPTYVVNYSTGEFLANMKPYLKKLNISLISIIWRYYNMPQILINLINWQKHDIRANKLNWVEAKNLEEILINSERTPILNPKIVNLYQDHEYSLVLWRNPWIVIGLSAYPEIISDPSNVIKIQDRFERIGYYKDNPYSFSEDFIKWGYLNQYIYIKDGVIYYFKNPGDFISSIWAGENINVEEKLVKWEDFMKMKGVYDCEMDINDEQTIKFSLWIRSDNLYYISSKLDKLGLNIMIYSQPQSWFNSVIKFVKSENWSRKDLNTLFLIPVSFTGDDNFQILNLTNLVKIKQIL